MARSHRSYALLRLALLPILVISCVYLPVTVHAGSSDLTVNNIWLEDASQPGQPISQLSLGQSFNIVATLKNLGQETAYGYYIDVYYDSDYGRGGPDDILAGEVQTWYVGPLTAQDGAHTTKWVVDPDNLIAELDEGNNQKEYTFTIGQQTTTTTTTVYNSTSTTTEPTTTTATSTVQTTQVLASTGTTNVTSYTTTTVTSHTGTETSTSTIVVPTTVTVGPLASTSTVQTTQILTSTGTATVTGYTTTTVTSYTGTQTSTSTIVVPTTVTIFPSSTPSTVQTTQVLTSTGTTTVTGYTTTTVTSYTGTQTSTSTIVVPATVTIGASPATLTVQHTQFLISTATAMVTGYTTTTVTSHTATQTSTSTRVVYTTVTTLASAIASSPLVYLGFLSLLSVTAGRRVKVRKAWRIPKAHDHEWKEAVRRVEEDQRSCFQVAFLTSGGVANHGARPRGSRGRFPRRDFTVALPSGWG